MPSRPVALELETNLYIRFGSDGVLPQPQAQAFTWSVVELYPRDNALLIGWNVLFIPSHRIKAVADKLQDPLSAVAARLKRREVASEDGDDDVGEVPERGRPAKEDVQRRPPVQVVDRVNSDERPGRHARPAGTDRGKGFRWPEDVRTRLTD